MPGNGKNPANMSQTVGKMNSNRPSQAGFSPGVSPMDQQQVRPPKLGQAQPGKPIARNSPQPKGSGNGDMFNKQAASPKGNRTLPGAKGPGDAKVANKTKQAQTKSAREIKVHVTASSKNGVLAGSVNRLESQLGLGALKCGPSSLSDKATGDTSNESAYNPVVRGKGKKIGKIGTCGTCGKKMNACTCKSMQSTGHSLGAKKGWSVRNKGHLSKIEKLSHYKTMD